MADNWNCSGSGPHTEGTVKLYPLGKGATWIDLREHDKLMELYNTIGSLWK